jgi:hypothetical protein
VFLLVCACFIVYDLKKREKKPYFKETNQYIAVGDSHEVCIKHPKRAVGDLQAIIAFVAMRPGNDSWG